MLPGMATPLLAASGRIITTLNPADKSTNVALSNGNLTATFNDTTTRVGARATRGYATGSFLFSSTLVADSPGGNSTFVGLSTAGASFDVFAAAGFWGYRPLQGGQVWFNGATVATFATCVVGDVVTVIYEAGTTMRLFKNGTLLGNVTVSGLLYPTVAGFNNTPTAPVQTVNFSPSVPSGYSASPW